MGTTFKWVPEAPEYPGVYGIESANGATCTHNVNEALKFDTEAECKAWCDAHPEPPFVPREHGWG
jgi:hypothetical protein